MGRFGGWGAAWIEMEELGFATVKTNVKQSNDADVFHNLPRQVMRKKRPAHVASLHSSLLISLQREKWFQTCEY